MSELTKSQRQMLKSVHLVRGECDGLAPHGADQWRTIRALDRRGLVLWVGPGECGDGCERNGEHPHEVQLFVLTEDGHSAISKMREELK